MDEQQKLEISSRLRELKASSSETNESIADAVGVKERSVAGWLSPTKPQAMTYDNAKKLAELFNVDIDWLWRGREPNNGDLLGSLREAEGSTQLDRIEAALKKLAQGQRELSEGQAQAIRSLAAVEKRLKRGESQGKAQNS